MKNILLLSTIIVVGILLYHFRSRPKQAFQVHTLQEKIPTNQQVDERIFEIKKMNPNSNFVKPNNRMHHLFTRAEKIISPHNKLVLVQPGIERMYTKLTIDENLLDFVKQCMYRIIKKTTKLKEGIDYKIKTIEEVYQKVDFMGNQRYIVKCFLFDIPNFYEIRILCDFLILSNDLYINYVGDNLASNTNILNKYDYTMSNIGYLESRNHIQDNIREIVDTYYKQYFHIIGYDKPPLEYSHYISKLDTVTKLNIDDLSKNYLPPDIPQLNDPDFGPNNSIDWDSHGIRIPTGNNFTANNNSGMVQPNLPFDSPATRPHTRNYSGPYSFLQQVDFNQGGNVVSNSWYY